MLFTITTYNKISNVQIQLFLIEEHFWILKDLDDLFQIWWRFNVWMCMQAGTYLINNECSIFFRVGLYF